MREFVAVDVSEPGTRDARRAPSHLTLCFLGEVPQDRTEGVSARLQEVARKSAPFVLRLEGVGAFPSAARPRVVWVGVTTGREEVSELARRVREALAADAGPPEGEFVPHLTLFRVRSGADRTAAQELLAGARPPPPPREVRVDALLLKESVLDRFGATHRTLASFSLGATQGSSVHPATPPASSVTSLRQR